MKKEIKFSLVYRDMWQSSGKYQPRADQLARIAPVIAEMGCFARVETNGGAFEQVNLLYGENPNKAVRTFTKPLHEAGIQTHMLDRGLNGLRMYPVPADVRKLMYKVKYKQGVQSDSSVFCTVGIRLDQPKRQHYPISGTSNAPRAPESRMIKVVLSLVFKVRVNASRAISKPETDNSGLTAPERKKSATGAVNTDIPIKIITAYTTRAAAPRRAP